MTGDHLDRLRAWRHQLNVDHRAWYERNGHTVPEPLHPAGEEVPCHLGCGTDLRGPDGEHLPLLLADLDAAIDELDRLRTQAADFPDQLADAQEMALDKLVEAFGEGWDNCRLHLEDEARLKRGVAVTQYSNQLPWPTYVAPQRTDLDALCVRDAMADAAMRQPESGAAK